MARRSGMTLVELVLVVLILAVLASAAAGVLEGSDSQLRYEQTEARGVAIRSAIVGTDRTVNGQPDVAGFVADVGRLPASLPELLAVTWPVPNAWRGPYARPESVGTSQLYDGFGRPFDYVLGGELGPASLTSLGADRAAGGTGYDQDRSWFVTTDDCSLALPRDGVPTDVPCSVDVRKRGGTGTGTVTVVADLRWTLTDASGATVPRSISSVPCVVTTPATALVGFSPNADGSAQRAPIGLRLLRLTLTEGTTVTIVDRPILVVPRGTLPQLTVYVP